MTLRRSVALACAAAACLATVACSGDDDRADEPARTTAEAPDETTPPDTDASATTTATGGDDAGDCGWLTVAAAAEAIGVPMTLVAGGPGGCFFATESGEGPALQISAIQIAIDVDQYVEESKALCESDVVEVDAGDGGWACNSGINPQGLVVFGDELVIADVSDATSDDEGIQLAAQVAAELNPG
jgi:hypothetical protein